jgi:type II secretory pathway pseudopilin PulG
MVPIIAATAAASNAFRNRKAILRQVKARFRLEAQLMAQERFRNGSGKAAALSETADGLLSNIGRIPGRQSHGPVLLAGNGKSCRRAEKEPAASTP